MLMVIADKFNKEVDKLKEIPGRVILDPPHIPRIGEGIYIGYVPVARVTDVTYDYNQNIICVLCE